MPNVLEQIYYIEACKRLGVVYTPVFGGFSDKTLSDRIAELDATAKRADRGRAAVVETLETDV